MKKIKKSKAAGEFRDFILKGNIVDMAVGVIIGGAFGKIVTSLVDNIIMPLIGIMVGGVDFTGLSVKVLDAELKYGIFIQNIIDFLIIALCMFLFIKLIAKINAMREKL
ncbi:MAG: large conductance mechanosensitive channel protein MscL [Oscillospiraceae bacterium]|nr:large conductance mechanosensitive channel protein MscL [Candidatus Equicaccousia limihippi]